MVLKKEEQGSMENAVAFATIDCFTKLHQKKLLLKILKFYYKLRNFDLDRIKYIGNNKYQYYDGKIIVNFERLSDFFKNKELVKELESKRRYGMCHIRSLGVSPSIEDCRVVTGYITIGNKKYLHSVIEYNFNAETIILDWTRNIRIVKEEYINLTKFVEISSILGSDVLNDYKLFAGRININVKVYSLFRDEIINDIMNNPVFTTRYKLKSKKKK